MEVTDEEVRSSVRDALEFLLDWEGQWTYGFRSSRRCTCLVISTLVQLGFDVEDERVRFPLKHLLSEGYDYWDSSIDGAISMTAAVVGLASRDPIETMLSREERRRLGRARRCLEHDLAEGSYGKDLGSSKSRGREDLVLVQCLAALYPVLPPEREPGAKRARDLLQAMGETSWRRDRELAHRVLPCRDPLTDFFFRYAPGPSRKSILSWLRRRARAGEDGRITTPEGARTDTPRPPGSVLDTATGLGALLRGGLPSTSSCAQRAVRWLLQAQLPGGGWGDEPGSRPEPSRTCLALAALLAFNEPVCLQAAEPIANARQTIQPLEAAVPSEPLEECTSRGADREMEYRDVAVLWLDIVKSTPALFAASDYRGRGALVQGYVHLMRECVERWGGHYDKWTGDGFIAYFFPCAFIHADPGVDAAKVCTRAAKSCAQEVIRKTKEYFWDEGKIRDDLISNGITEWSGCRTVITYGKVWYGDLNAGEGEPDNTCVGMPLVEAARIIGNIDAPDEILANNSFVLEGHWQPGKDFFPHNLEEGNNILQPPEIKISYPIKVFRFKA